MHSSTFVRALMVQDTHQPEGKEGELDIKLELCLFVDVIPVRPRHLTNNRIYLIAESRERERVALLIPIPSSSHSPSGHHFQLHSDRWPPCS